MKASIRPVVIAGIGWTIFVAWNVFAGDGSSLSPAATESNSQSKQTMAAGEQIKWSVLSAGGNRGSNASYILSATIGQTAAGSGSSASYTLSQGFWQEFAAGCMCGDADGNNIFTISDAVFLINYIFAGGPAPYPLCRGDADGNGIITISDAVYLINYIFAGGPPPHC